MIASRMDHLAGGNARVGPRLLRTDWAAYVVRLVMLRSMAVETAHAVTSATPRAFCRRGGSSGTSRNALDRTQQCLARANSPAQCRNHVGQSSEIMAARYRHGTLRCANQSQVANEPVCAREITKPAESAEERRQKCPAQTDEWSAESRRYCPLRNAHSG